MRGLLQEQVKSNSAHGAHLQEAHGAHLQHQSSSSHSRTSKTTNQQNRKGSSSGRQLAVNKKVHQMQTMPAQMHNYWDQNWDISTCIFQRHFSIAHHPYTTGISITRTNF